MKKHNLFLLLALPMLLIVASCSPDEPEIPVGTDINYHLASASEARTLMQSNTAHYASMNQMDIDWRLKTTGGSLADLQAFAWQQALDFTDAEGDFIAEAIEIIEDDLKTIGCRLPIPDEVVYIKTTMLEEGRPAAYTIKNQIFLGQRIFDRYLPKPDQTDDEIHAALMTFAEIMAHELFHSISRNSPDFRQQMYELIGFTVLPNDIELPAHIKNLLSINPDVEHIDNYAEFTINGEKKRCELLTLYNKSWAEAAAEMGNDVSFFNYIDPILVNLDDMTQLYTVDQTSDFWDKVGRNTDYVIAPEECMADNFSYAVVRGVNPMEPYASPDLILNIINTLKEYK